jgi:hypothetical protein
MYKRGYESADDPRRGSLKAEEPQDASTSS